MSRRIPEYKTNLKTTLRQQRTFLLWPILPCLRSFLFGKSFTFALKMSFVRILIHFMLVLLASGLPADKRSPQASEKSGASNQPKLSRIFRATINLGAFSSPIPIQGGQRIGEYRTIQYSVWLGSADDFEQWPRLTAGRSKEVLAARSRAVYPSSISSTTARSL